MSPVYLSGLLRFSSLSVWSSSCLQFIYLVFLVSPVYLSGLLRESCLCVWFSSWVLFICLVFSVSPIYLVWSFSFLLFTLSGLLRISCLSSLVFSMSLVYLSDLLHVSGLSVWSSLLLFIFSGLLSLSCLSCLVFVFPVYFVWSFFSENCRPDMFSVLYCCLHPSQISVCCPFKAV